MVRCSLIPAPGRFPQLLTTNTCAQSEILDQLLTVIPPPGVDPMQPNDTVLNAPQANSYRDIQKVYLTTVDSLKTILDNVVVPPAVRPGFEVQTRAMWFNLRQAFFSAVTATHFGDESEMMNYVSGSSYGDESNYEQRQRQQPRGRQGKRSFDRMISEDDEAESDQMETGDYGYNASSSDNNASIEPEREESGVVDTNAMLNMYYGVPPLADGASESIYMPRM